MVPKLVVYKINTGFCLSLSNIYSFLCSVVKGKDITNRRQVVAYLHQYIFEDLCSSMTETRQLDQARNRNIPQ